MVDEKEGRFKRNIFKQRGRRYVQGAVKSPSRTLMGAACWAYIYSGNFALGTLSEQVLESLKGKFPQDDFIIEDLPKRESTRSVAFKITADCSLLDSLMDCDTWLEGIRTKKFFFARQERGP